MALLQSNEVFPPLSMVLRLTRYLTSGLTDEALRLQASYLWYKSTIIKLRNSNHSSQMAADEAKSSIEFYASLKIPRVNAGRIVCLTESSYINR